MGKTLYEDVAVIIPAFNEAERVSATLVEIQKRFNKIYLVDDGSTDTTSEVVRSKGILPILHSTNLGQGAAIQTGLSAALLDKKNEFFLTYDADGQHNLDDACLLVEKIKNSTYDILIGSRFCAGGNAENIPIKKRTVLKLAVLFTRFDSGLKVTDTHNGLRIMTRQFVETLQIRQSGMAHASEILNHIKNIDANWNEFPVKINYTDYSIKKGQSILNSVNILTELLHK